MLQLNVPLWFLVLTHLVLVLWCMGWTWGMFVVPLRRRLADYERDRLPDRNDATGKFQKRSES